MILKLFIINLILFIMVLVSVAFITLMEQKVLSAMSVRLGPQYVGYWGILQSFADAVKLFIKEMWSPSVTSFFFFYISPIVSLSLALSVWLLFPFVEENQFLIFSVVFFIIITSLNVYPILMMGWASNNKYAVLGSIRSVSQMVSYEISLIIIMMSFIWINSSFLFKEWMSMQKFMLNIFLFYPLFMIWFVSILAEMNRTPYDFSEGESELVSGFNVEYMGGPFVLIFLSEYMSIILMSFITVLLFFSSYLSMLSILLLFMMSFFVIWVRATVPRYRYDKLMYLAWKNLLPSTLIGLTLIVLITVYV